ncbi:MAG: type-F conjugative transfer system protein TrbI [Alphaproteobacteria bacterium]|nr:type-F conjugative transfer system protein TrbI [Alphaproteobacteria bacterium]
MNLNVFKVFDKDTRRSERDIYDEKTKEYGSLLTYGDKDNEQEEERKETQHRIFVLSMLAIALSFLALSFSVFNSPKANFVVVDMAKLLRQKAATLVSGKEQKVAGGMSDVSPELAREAVLIRASIERYAAANKVIVVAKGAVFGGNVKEVTDEIETLL